MDQTKAGAPPAAQGAYPRLSKRHVDLDHVAKRSSAHALHRRPIMEHSMPIESVLFLALVAASLVIFAGALAYADWATRNRFSSYEIQNGSIKRKSRHASARSS